MLNFTPDDEVPRLDNGDPADDLTVQFDCDGAATGKDPKATAPDEKDCDTVKRGTVRLLRKGTAVTFLCLPEQERDTLGFQTGTVAGQLRGRR